MIGIYKITSPNNRIYIGQSVDIEKRFKGYKRFYVKNKKQTKLHRSFLKYGVINHTFEVIKECEISELNYYERYYQDLYDCLNNGLNCTLTKTNDKSGKASKETLLKMSQVQKGNQNWLGKKHSEESKIKMSLAAKGRKHSDEVNKSKGRKGRTSNRIGCFSEKHPRSLTVLQYDLEGNFIKEWVCLMDIKREYNYNAGNISQCINGKFKTAYKFIWKRKN